MALWISGGKKLIGALGESIANGIPCLARASLVTVAWMSKFVHTVGDGEVLQSIEFSSLIRQLTESLRRDNTIEERVLASFSLLALSKSSGTYAYGTFKKQYDLVWPESRPSMIQGFVRTLF